MFEVRITSLFHATKCAWVEQFSTWRKCCIFVCENFRTHNFRFRNSLYFFVLETPEKMPPLNTFGQNSLKSVVHATLEMQDSNSEGLISLKRRLVSRKHDDLQIEFEKFLNQSLELTPCVKFFSAHELWRFVFSQKVTSVSEVDALKVSFEALKTNVWN